jgi:hypothetical protein
MDRKAELSINLIVIIVIALLILVIVVFILGGRGGDFGRATECTAAGGQCVVSFDCQTNAYVGPNNVCGTGQVCCPVSYIRRR